MRPWRSSEATRSRSSSTTSVRSGTVPPPGSPGDRRPHHMIRPILKYGDAVLRERAKPVAAVTADVERLVDDLVETMYAAPGVGLAAPQIGMSLRIFVVDISVGRDPSGLMVFINPEFIERDGLQ